MRTQSHAVETLKELRARLDKRCGLCWKKRQWRIIDTAIPGAHRFEVHAECDCGIMTFRAVK